MRVRVNGDDRHVHDLTTVAEVVASVTDREDGVAVACNGSVVPRSHWPRTRLAEADRVEVLTAQQGG